MKKIISAVTVLAITASTFGFALPLIAATTWNMTGAYIVSFTCNFGCGGAPGPYLHDLNLVQDVSGNITGTDGGYPAGGPHIYTWVVDSGLVVGNIINFMSHYTATADAVVPQTVMNMSGTIAPDGTMSGTWSDNYQGGNRSGTWATTSGTAANCSVITVKSSTSTQFKHLTTIDPGASSLDSLFTLGISGAAVLTGPDGFPGAWDAAAGDPDVAGAIWVNNNSVAPSTPAGAGDGQNGNENVWRLFSHVFSLPAGAVVSSANLHMAGDNSVQAFLDNASVGSAPSFNAVVDLPLTVTPGTHELEFVVKNDAYNGATNPTGVIYRADINYCAPITTEVASCPAAPSVANKLLKEHGVKANATSGNYVSSVAHFMGPQTYFNGIAACNTAAYRAAVNTYLDTVVNAY
jgi:hypothetical protein